MESEYVSDILEKNIKVLSRFVWVNKNLVCLG